MKRPHRSSSAHRSTWIAAGLLAALAGTPSATRADGLKSAQVSRIFNDVRLLPENQAPRPASVSDRVTGKAAVQTGTSSRAELTFSDLTLTRLGANSYFSFVNGTRDMNLNSGTMLLQVPKDAGGATIHTAGITAGITGTTLMVEYNAKSYSKVVVLEGTVRVSLNGNVGESVLVRAGQILIVPAKAKSLPDPVNLNLKTLYASSGLITSFGPLPSRGLIDREIGQQTRKLGSGQLKDAGLFIVGTGTQVQAGNLSYVAGNDARITALQGPDTPVSLREPGAANAAKYGPLNLVAGQYVINPTTTIRTDPFITTNGRQDTGRTYRSGAASPDGAPGEYLLGAATNRQFTPASPGNFDTYFGAVGDIAAFHFGSLVLQGAPASISTADGPVNLALVADTDIVDRPLSGNAPGPVFRLDGLNELLLATRQGSITLTNGTSFRNTDENAPNLTLYAQGGNLTLGAGTAVDISGGVNLHSDNAMTLGGTIRAADPSVALAFRGLATAEALAYGPLTLTATATFQSGQGGVDLASVNGALTIDGAVLSGGGANLSAPGGTLTINGTVNSAGQLRATAAGNLGVGGTGSLTSSNNQVFLQSTGGTAAFNGSATAAGQVVLQAAGDVATGGASSLTSNAGSVYLYSTGGAATNNGTINAGGTAYLEGATVAQLGSVNAAGGLLFLSGGNLTAGGTASTPAAATLQGNGTMTLNNARLSADTLKLQVFGNNGTLLIGGGSVLSGNTQLNLFAGGSGGRIEFTGNTTLTSSVPAVLTASAIRIDNNVTVTINGPTALMYANTLQFSGSGGDGSTTGGFGGSGAVQAGNYAGGPSTARRTAQGTGTAANPASASNRPGGANAVAGPVLPSRDGRYDLSGLVTGARPAMARSAAVPGGVRPAGTAGRTDSATAAEVPAGQNRRPQAAVLR